MQLCPFSITDVKRVPAVCAGALTELFKTKETCEVGGSTKSMPKILFVNACSAKEKP